MFAKKIPNTLREAVDTLLTMLSDEDRARILAMDELTFLGTSHFALGLCMRNRWVYPATKGWFAASYRAVDADNISSFVCKQLHRAVHGKVISDYNVCPSWMDDDE